MKANFITLFALAFGAGLLLTLINRFSKQSKSLRKIPGPFLASFTNLPLKLAVLTGRRTMYIHNLHLRYGPFVRISPSEISISDPESCRTIHKAGSGFWKSDWYSRFIAKPVPTLFSMMDPKQHGIRRKLFARAFSKTEIRMRWEPMVKDTVERALDKMTKDMKKNGEVNILDLWLSMATDVSASLMFGDSFQTLEKGEFDNYFRTLQLAGKGGAISDELPLLGFIGRRIPIQPFYELFRSNDYLTVFGERAIMNGMSQGNDRSGIFTQLEPSEAAPDTKGTPPLTSLDLSTEAGNFIIAGTDTSAFTLTCLVWSVLCQPPIQRALEEEVAQLEEGFNDAQLEALPLLNAVINETLRLYGPASASLPRLVPPGGVEMGGYFIPESVTVSTQAWTLHRNEYFWPEPERFDPNRWLEDSVQESMKMAFAPFGVGPRGCIGVHLATMEMRYATALFFRRCRGARLSSTCSERLEFENYFLMRPKGNWTIVAS